MPEDNKAKFEKLTGLDLSKADDLALFILSELQENRRSVEELKETLKKLTERVEGFQAWLYSIDEIQGLHAVWVAALFDRYLPAGPTGRDPSLPPLGRPRNRTANPFPNKKDGFLTWEIGEPIYPRVFFEEERKKMEPKK